MKTVDLMKVLAHTSRSKTNRDLAIMAGLGILVVGGFCYYYYIQNQQLKYSLEKKQSQVLNMSGQISSLKEGSNKLQEKLDKIHMEKKKNMEVLKEEQAAYKKDT